MNPILQVFYSIFSGAMLSLAIPNELFLLGFPPLTLIALIPYYAAISRSKNYRNVMLCGLFQAGTTHFISSFWLGKMENYAYFTLGGSAFAEAGLGALMALFFYLPYANLKRKSLYINSAKTPFYRLPAFRILYFAAIYTAFEWVKSSGYLGYPWGTVSSAMYKWHSLTQVAAITGAYGVTFLAALINGCIYEGLKKPCSIVLPHVKKIIRRNTWQMIKMTFVLMVLTLCYGEVQLNIKRNPVKKLTTIMIQQNQDPWKQSTDTKTLKRSQELAREQIKKLKEEDKEPQLILFSEGALQRKFPNALSYYEHSPTGDPLISFIKETKAPLITGGSYTRHLKLYPDITRYYNSALFFDANGSFKGYYAKLHLVPFAESIPYMDIPAVADFVRKVAGISAGWTQGTQLTYFEIPCDYYNPDYIPTVKVIDGTNPSEIKKDEPKPTVKICAPICFDDSFTDVIRPLFLYGAELFTNVTDDSWSKTKSSEYQHFVIASYRSIEYRTTFLRSTNSGYSVVLDPCGRVLADQPLFEESSCSYDVPIYSRMMTTYARFGNWLPYSCIALFIIYAVYMFLLYVKEAQSMPSRTLKLKKKDLKEAKFNKISLKQSLKEFSKKKKDKKHKKEEKDSKKKSKKHSKK